MDGNNLTILKTFITTIFKDIADVLPKIVIGLIVFVVTWIIATAVRSFINFLLSRTGLKELALLNLISQIGYISVFILGSITALGTMGVNISALVAGLGLLGFSLGYAMKDILSSAFSGFLILLYRPFNISDRITMGNTTGEVMEINLRYTILKEDEKCIMIPNSSILTNVITIVSSSVKKQKERNRKKN